MHTLSPYELERLLMDVSRGDGTAFQKLFDIYHQKIYSFAFFLIRSENLAKDITQDIFVKIWMHRNELGDISNFNAWLKTVVRNHTYNCLHRLATERMIIRKMSANADETSIAGDNVWLTREYDRLLEQAIEQLSSQQKKVFIMSRREGMKHEAIAKALGLSVNTVKNHIKAALQSIRRFFENHSDAIVAIAGSFFLVTDFFQF